MGLCSSRFGHMCFDGTFPCKCCSDPGAKEGLDYRVVSGTRLTPGQRDEYVRLAVQYRLTEFDIPVSVEGEGFTVWSDEEQTS